MQNTHTFLVVALLAGIWQAQLLRAAVKDIKPEQFIISFWLQPASGAAYTQTILRKWLKPVSILLRRITRPPPDKVKSINLNILNLCATNGMKAMITDPRITESGSEGKRFSRRNWRQRSRITLRIQLCTDTTSRMSRGTGLFRVWLESVKSCPR